MIKQKAKKKCIKGFQCGYTCIKRGKVCRKNASPAVEGVVNSFTKIVNVGKDLGGVYLTPAGTVIKNLQENPEEAAIHALMSEAGFAPKIINYGKLGEVNFIEMEYLEGYTTAYDSKLTSGQAAKLEEAIVFLHKRGLAHNDLHGGNILVNSATDDLKLIDFGMAQAANLFRTVNDLKSYETFAKNWPDKSPQADLLKTAFIEPDKKVLDIYMARLQDNASTASPSEAYMDGSVTIKDLVSESKKIGQGAFGRAYLTPKGTIVKVPKQELGKLETSLMKLMGDAGYSPKLLATGKIGDKGFVEMEYLKGYKPGFKAKREDFGEAQLKQLGDALAYLHQNGYTHNDVHMGNVMINTKTGDLKLIDYGLATKADVYSMASDLNLLNTGHDWSSILASDLKWPAGTPQAKAMETLYPDADSFPSREELIKVLDIYLKETK